MPKPASSNAQLSGSGTAAVTETVSSSGPSQLSLTKLVKRSVDDVALAMKLNCCGSRRRYAA